MLAEIKFGVDYYPEHWNKENWQKDLTMMQELGIDIVRMAEFSWSLLEPYNGSFNFDWLEEVIAMCADHGIKVVLGTPTAAPPAWMIKRHPEILPVGKDGLPRYFGGRHHDCQSNPIYRHYIKRYVENFTDRFGKNANVIGWQVDNELGNSHGGLCYCKSCEEHFQNWLAERYQTIENLNENWGTTFWSQDYQDFTDIQAPKRTVTGENPSQILDWKRCHSDLINEFHQFQAEIIREKSPGRFITHNMMGFSDVVSYFDLGKQLDFASHDQYPAGHFLADQNGFKGDRCAAELDFIRGVKDQKTFWIMEQQSSITGWETLGRAPKPGQISLWSLQSVAHGADAIVYFRWRSCSMGTEQYWHGILPHSGIPGRAYYEIKDLIQQFKPVMKEFHGTLPKAKVGIVFSYDQEHALNIQPHHPNLHYVDHALTYYKGLYRRNIAVDFIQDTADFTQYEVVIAPLQYLMTPELEAKYAAYVENGGQLVMTMRTGVKHWNNRCLIDQALPGKLSEVLGIEVHEYDCLRDIDVAINWQDSTFIGTKWSDLITVKTAEPLATYASEFYQGTPVITVNAFGQGKAYYVGTEMTPDLVDRFFDEFTPIVEETIETPFGLEVAMRSSAEKNYYFLLNHTAEAQNFQVPTDWDQVFANHEQTPELLAPYDCKVFVQTK